jgi:tripartite-type tricarboxylate transporter receptor subunit TctC
LSDPAELDAFEALSVAVRSEEPLPAGRFSATHYCAVHRHLFTTVKRSALLPDLPAIGEVLPGYEVALWNGIMGPAGPPAPVVARLGAEMVATVGSPEMRSKLGEQGSDPVGSTPQDFAAFVAAEQPKWAELVRISGATVE